MTGHHTCTPTQQDFLEPDKTFIKKFTQNIQHTINKHNLISHNDKVLVAVSGGKDSTTVLHILKELGYNIEAFTIDVHIGCYTEKNLENIKAVCAKENIKLSVYSFRKAYGASVCHIQTTLAQAGAPYGTCTVCGVLRRRLINMAARNAGATVVATGHNMDDEVQAFLMNLLKNRLSLSAASGPDTGITSSERFVKRIKPLYFTSEDDIKTYSRMKRFPVQYTTCPCAVKSFRYTIRTFLEEIQQQYPKAKQNLLNYLLSKQEKIKTHTRKQTTHTCTQCGEPSSGNICRACQLLEEYQRATKFTSSPLSATHSENSEIITATHHSKSPE